MKTRGAVPVLVIVALAALAALAFPSLKFHLFERKPPVAQLDIAQQKLAEAQAQAKEAQAALAETKAAERAKKDQQITHGQQMVDGAIFANARAPAGPEVKLTGDLLTRAQLALALANGDLSAAKQAEIEAIVNGALSQVQAERDAARAALKQKDAELVAITNDRDALKEQIPQLVAQQRATEARAAAAQQTVTAKTNEVKRWAAAKVQADARASSFMTQARHLLWIIAAIAGVWLLGPILSFLAGIFPAFSGPSKVVNGALSFALHRQSTDLQRQITSIQGAVGGALGEIRANLPEAQAKVRDIFDKHTESMPDVQSAIGASANATHGAIIGSAVGSTSQ